MSPSQDHCDMLWYQEPAATWEEALPIGTGRLGAMISGSTDVEHLWMNEDSVWHGGPQNRINPLARENLPKVRELLFQERAKEAEDLLSRTFTSMPSGKRHYEPLGDVYLHFGHKFASAKDGNEAIEPSTGLRIPDLDLKKEGHATEYNRSLDIKTGVGKTSYSFDGVRYMREYFASVADHVVCVRLSANKQGALSFKIRIHRCSLEKAIDGLNCMYDSIEIIPQGLLMKATCGGKGAVEAAMGVMVVPIGGAEMECLEGSEVDVRRADSVLILISGETTFRNPDSGTAALTRLTQAAGMSWDQLLARHLKIYAPLESRFSLHLGHSDACRLPTDKRLARIKSDESGDRGKDNCLIALLVNYARYLLVSCSLSGLPANIQGIWNQDMQPAWGSKFTININVQMNYWGAEVLNLTECHQPLFAFLERLSVTGRQIAREMYGCEGFVAHHSSDIWADAAPQDRYIPSTYWCLGGAWLATHLWEHYLFTQDQDFLRWAWPILRDAALFFENFLLESPEKENSCNEKGQKYLVVAPSTSCENTYFIPGTCTAASICVGSTWDSQILYELFSACAAATEILHGSEKNDNKGSMKHTSDGNSIQPRPPPPPSHYTNLLSRLPPPRIGRHGQLQEWARDYDEAEPGHRHISHAFGLYPGYSLRTPAHQDALRVTLGRRLAAGGATPDGVPRGSCACTLG